MFEPTCPISAKLLQLEPWQRSILNPPSLLELSVHVRSILSAATAPAARLAGADGVDEEVVALAVFE
jgi:hypothetical protein